MDLAKQLYQKFGITPLEMTPTQIFQLLGAFWPHFALHKRKCDKTEESIISRYDDSCIQPVWKRDIWIKEANPPSAQYNPNRGFFEQLWELFQKCPIPHNLEVGNINCEYTDDWFYSKNCYLCHSGVECEDSSFCYRTLGIKDSQFCVFSFQSERCTDIINSSNCYNVTYAINSKQCTDSAFLFDCRNTRDSLFCWNLRNKQYCIYNQQLTKEDYEKEKAKYNLASRQQYEVTKQKFWEELKTKAWWKAKEIEQCENSTGDKLDKCKNVENCFYIQESEDCANVFRAFGNKDCLNVISPYKAELCYMCTAIQDGAYNQKFCFDTAQCQNMEYSAHCFQCQDCFGCCGLVGKKYHIFNKPYSEEEYHKKVKEIKSQLKQKGTYGKFFPPYFASTPYDESISGVHWPLTPEQQQSAGFKVKQNSAQPQNTHSPISEIPDSPHQADKSITQKSFWDEEYARPFKIRAADLKFCKENNVPLPNQYYLHRIKDNFSSIFCNGKMRETICAQTGKPVVTSLPEYLDNRILSEEAYLELMR